MKNFISRLLKYSHCIYVMYYYTVNLFLMVMRLFIKTDDKLVLFNSYGGQKYDDSPKEIFKLMVQDERFADYKFVWAFHAPEKFDVPGAKVIKTDTFEYFKTALKAKSWITNSSIERGLKFKPQKTFYFNSGHGEPIKKFGSDISSKNKGFKGRVSAEDAHLVQGDFEIAVYSRCLNVNGNNFLKFGLPRNDKFVNYTKEYRDELKRKLGLPCDRKIILYAPTAREYERDGEFNIVLKPPMDISKWEKQLADKYCLLFRAHYAVSKAMEFKDTEFIKNVSEYPSLDDLMIVSDILISDYSSIFFDFSIMDKPMFHFTYDYDQYVKERGVYFDIREEVSGTDNESALIAMLQSFQREDEIERTKKFRAKYVNYFGTATKQSVDYIYERIKN